MIALFLTCVLAINPASYAKESVDYIEVNHYHDEKGLPVYDQVIFYDWCDCQGEHHARHYCLLERYKPLEKLPIVSNGRVHVQWYDANEHLDRDLSSATFKETWTQVDPERENKKILDERLRVKLYTRPAKEPK